AEDGIRDFHVTGVQTCALPIWGRRETVLAKMAELCERMRYRPYEFVLNFDPEHDADRLKGFKHRTFQPIDAFWLTRNLGALLRQHDTGAHLFIPHPREDHVDVGAAFEGVSRAVIPAHRQSPGRFHI